MIRRKTSFLIVLSIISFLLITTFIFSSGNVGDSQEEQLKSEYDDREILNKIVSVHPEKNNKTGTGFKYGAEYVITVEHFGDGIQEGDFITLNDFTSPSEENKYEGVVIFSSELHDLAVIKNVDHYWSNYFDNYNKDDVENIEEGQVLSKNQNGVIKNVSRFGEGFSRTEKSLNNNCKQRIDIEVTLIEMEDNHYIEQGDSGSPVINENGEVVGVLRNSMKNGSVGALTHYSLFSKNSIFDKDETLERLESTEISREC